MDKNLEFTRIVDELEGRGFCCNSGDPWFRKDFNEDTYLRFFIDMGRRHSSVFSYFRLMSNYVSILVYSGPVDYKDISRLIDIVEEHSFLFICLLEMRRPFIICDILKVSDEYKIICGNIDLFIKFDEYGGALYSKLKPRSDKSGLILNTLTQTFE